MGYYWSQRCLVWVRILLHSQFHLQVERLLHIVVVTALVDEDGVGSSRHLLLVLLLQLEGALQVLIRQHKWHIPEVNTQAKQLISRRRGGFCETRVIQTNPTSSRQRAWMVCLRVAFNGLFSAFSSANLFSSANTLPSIPYWRKTYIHRHICTWACDNRHKTHCSVQV